MNVRNKVWGMVLIGAIGGTASAGGLLTNTNTTAHFLRRVAMDGVISADNTYANPAGLAFIPEDGMYLSADVQSAFQHRTIYSEFAGFAGNLDRMTPAGAPTRIKYQGEATAPVIPSVFGTYRMGKWTFSGFFAITGGGGKATFNDGLGSFERTVSLIPSLLNSYGQDAQGYSVDCYMKGRQYIYGLQIGASYRPTEWMSVYIGGRGNFVSNRYEGYIRDIQSVIDGNRVNVSEYYAQRAAAAQQAAMQFEAAGDAEHAAQYAYLAGVATQVSEQTKDKELDCTQSGWGFTPIIGLDFKVWNLNIGLKYEHNTKLNIENDTKVDDTGMFGDGVNTPNDIPGLFGAGVEWAIIPDLRVSAGYHHFFDKNARMADRKQKLLKGNTNEYLAGIEWHTPIKWLELSGGYQRTHYGLSDEFMNDMSFVTSSYSLGFGAGFIIRERLKFDVAYFWTTYQTYHKAPYAYSETLPIMTSDDFTRTNKVFGIGVTYKFGKK